MASNPVVNSSDDDDGEEGGGAAGVSAGEEGSSSDYEEDCYFAFVEKSETPSFDIDDPQWIDDASFEIVDGDVTSSSSIADVSLDPRIDESCMVETEFYNKRPGNGRRKPVKGVRVKFQDLSKPYIARITNQTNYHRFLQIVKGEEPSSEQTRNNEMPEELQGLNPEEQEKQKELWSKELATVSFVYLLIPSVIAKLKVLGGYGPPAELDGLTEEEQESIKEDWSKELTTVEEEIQTLQSVLSAKMKRAQELKQKLGYSVWRDFQYDMTQGIRNVKESNVYQNVEEKVSQLGKAVVEAPIYQKTESVIKTTAEKTTSLFGGFGSGLTSGISSKLGQLKNSESFRSLEEKVGGVYENVKTKVSTSRSSSMQSFDDALREAEAAKKSGSTATTPIPEEH